MAENQIENKSIKHTQHKIVCDNRRNLCITGVEKADNASPTHFSCVAMGCELHITGKEMQVNKLDVEQGVVELQGEIDAIEYATAKKVFSKGYLNNVI